MVQIEYLDKVFSSIIHYKAKKSPFKESNGEVFTPYILVKRMLSLMPRDILMNPKIKYLDAGAGMGIFSIVLYFVLVEHGHKTTNIIDNMLNLVEINPINVAVIKKVFHKLVPEYAGSFKNIINNDYLSSDLPYEPNTIDIILGNPPYNVGGKIKVQQINRGKKLDGKAIWTRFVYRSYNLLKSGGMLLLIIPSIWCKPDKAKIYELFTERFEIKYLEFIIILRPINCSIRKRKLLPV